MLHQQNSIHQECCGSEGKKSVLLCLTWAMLCARDSTKLLRGAIGAAFLVAKIV